MDIVTVTNLTKTFGHGPRQVKALDGITLGVEKGKFTAIVGASGSGKTTLLHCIGGLYRPDSGTVTVDGQDLASLTEEQLTVYRRRKIGFVFQGNHLVPELTVQENILFPLALDDARPDWDFFREITRLLGLTGKLDALPHTLSGGAQQCTAIARALTGSDVPPPPARRGMTAGVRKPHGLRAAKPPALGEPPARVPPLTPSCASLA